MQLSTMRSEARLIFGQTDTANTTISESQLTDWANEFYRLACVKLETVPIKNRTYTTPAGASPTVTLNSNTITVDFAKILEQASSQWRKLKIIDIGDLIVLDPDWEHAAVSIPTHFVRMGTFSARLYPGPNTANESIANALETFGLEIPTALSADSDTPDLPSNIHDIFPHYMAAKALYRLGDPARGTAELVYARGTLKDQALISTRFSRNRGWQWPGGGSGIDFPDPTGLFGGNY